MTRKKIASATFAFAILALAGCSSSVGDGTPAPRNVTVVVPPGDTTVVPADSSTTTTTTTYPSE